MSNFKKMETKTIKDLRKLPKEYFLLKSPQEIAEEFKCSQEIVYKEYRERDIKYKSYKLDEIYRNLEKTLTYDKYKRTKKKDLLIEYKITSHRLRCYAERMGWIKKKTTK